MRAVGVIEYGGPEALEVVGLPTPEAGPGQVRVRVRATAVSPTDTHVRAGTRAEQQAKTGPPPYVPGMDVAGVLDQIGEGADTELEVGDQVMAMVVPRGSHGAYSEYVVLSAESVARMPAGSSFAEASTLPMNGLTARLSLDQLNLQPGQTLAVTGAAGCYGGYMVELAKADGLRVIADSSEADEELVASFGADVIVHRGDDVADRIREHAPRRRGRPGRRVGTDGTAGGRGARRWRLRLGAGLAGQRRAGHPVPHHLGVRIRQRPRPPRPPAPTGRRRPSIPASGGHRPHGERLRSPRPIRSRRHPRPLGHRVLTGSWGAWETSPQLSP